MEKEIKWLFKEKYKGKPNKSFYKDIKRLKTGEPVDYIIGFTEFLGCKIDLSKKPLIPRPETEFWVQEVLKSMKPKKNIKVLDIFSGSGCIGMSVMRHVKDSRVTFSDKKDNAISQIKLNCKINRINKRRYSVIKSDIFDEVKGKYDYIFANPPYIPTVNERKIQRSVLEYEPNEALFGGGDGLYYIKKLIKQAKKHLNENGRIFMEFDSPQKKIIAKLVKNSGYLSYKFHKDQHGKQRWIVIE